MLILLIRHFPQRSTVFIPTNSNVLCGNNFRSLIADAAMMCDGIEPRTPDHPLNGRHVQHHARERSVGNAQSSGKISIGPTSGADVLSDIASNTQRPVDELARRGANRFLFVALCQHPRPSSTAHGRGVVRVWCGADRDDTWE